MFDYINKKSFYYTISFFLIIVLYSMFTFTLHEGEKAARFKFGDPIESIEKAGLHFKIPFFHTIEKVTAKSFIYDSDPKDTITKDKKTLLVDIFSVNKINDPIKFFQKVHSKAQSLLRIDDQVFSNLKSTLGSHIYDDIVVDKRNELMADVQSKASSQLKNYEITSEAVYTNRVDLLEANKKATYSRMIAERKREAQKYRSEGKEESDKITSQASKESARILTTAKKEAFEIKGKADGQAARIYAKAYSRDPKFYNLYKGLETARDVLSTGNAFISISDDTEFVKQVLR